MRYVFSEFEAETQERMYRIYVTDCLYAQLNQMAPDTRYIDLIKKKPADNRTAEQIVNDSLTRLNIKVIEDEPT